MDFHTALELCKKVRENTKDKWWSTAFWQCWGCNKFSGGDDKRCFNSNDGKFTGCQLVNKEAKPVK